MNKVTPEVIEDARKYLLDRGVRLQPTIISPRSKAMLDEIVSEGFKVKIYSQYGDMEILFYYSNWKRHWRNYQTHGNGD